MSRLGGVTLTWLGHATLHLKTAAGTSILIDPWIDGNPVYPADKKKFDKIDVMLLTHGHSDHTGSALEVAKQHNPAVVCMVELGDLLEGQGLKSRKLVAMNLGGTTHVEDLEISMVEARHSSSYMIDGKPVYAGPPAGLIVKPANGPVIYFAGDTSLFSDMKLIKALYAPEVAVLPIGDFYTMGPKHAAIAAEWIGAKTVIPIHFGTFPVLRGRPDTLREALEGKGIDVLELTIGEPTA